MPHCAEFSVIRQHSAAKAVQKSAPRAQSAAVCHQFPFMVKLTAKSKTPNSSVQQAVAEERKHPAGVRPTLISRR